MWPTLPLAIKVACLPYELEDNVVAALEHEDRLSRISVLDDSNSTLKRITEAMKHPFPVLTNFSIWSTDQTAMVLPDSLLGGSAPHLRSLCLRNVEFSALPKLLLSATGLVDLSLWHITQSEWIPPEAVVDCLSLLTRLERLHIEFKSYQCRLDRTNRRPHSTRTVLPTLTVFTFQGMTDYLDSLFTPVDTPLLKRVEIRVLDPPTFDIMRITSLIGLTETFEMPVRAYMLLAHELVDVMVSSRLGTTGDKMLQLSMTLKFSDWYLTRAHYPSSPSQSTIESRRQRTRARTMDRGRTHWLDLLRFFPTTEDLYLFERVAECIALALGELSPEGAAEVLPALQNLFIENLRPSGPVGEAIGVFVAARRLSGHPVAVLCWIRGRE